MTYSREMIDPNLLADILGDLRVMGAHCFDDREDYEDIVRYIASNLGLEQEFITRALEVEAEESDSGEL